MFEFGAEHEMRAPDSEFRGRPPTTLLMLENMVFALLLVLIFQSEAN